MSISLSGTNVVSQLLKNLYTKLTGQPQSLYAGRKGWRLENGEVRYKQTNTDSFFGNFLYD